MKSSRYLKTDTPLNYILIRDKPLCLPSRNSRHNKFQGTKIKLRPVRLEDHAAITRYLCGGITFRRQTCNYSDRTSQSK